MSEGGEEVTALEDTPFNRILIIIINNNPPIEVTTTASMLIIRVCP